MIQNNSYDADTLHEECGVFGMYDFDGYLLLYNACA